MLNLFTVFTLALFSLGSDHFQNECVFNAYANQVEIFAEKDAFPEHNELNTSRVSKSQTTNPQKSKSGWNRLTSELDFFRVAIHHPIEKDLHLRYCSLLI
ncbi:MAG: hypothetical protein JXR10_08580 [Cyclobacteriaceae bacterium]